MSEYVSVLNGQLTVEGEYRLTDGNISTGVFTPGWVNESFDVAEGHRFILDNTYNIKQVMVEADDMVGIYFYNESKEIIAYKVIIPSLMGKLVNVDYANVKYIKIDTISEKGAIVNEVELFSEQPSVPFDRYIIKQNEEYMYCKDGQWISLGTNVTEGDFELYGMDTLSDISSSSWSKLIVFGKNISILNYTNKEKKNKTLNIEYYNGTSVTREIHLTAIPHPQLLLPVGDIEVGDVESLALNNTVSGLGDLKIIVSPDSGTAWQGKYPVNITDLRDVKTNGFTPEEFNALTKEELAELFPTGKARFAFYLEQESSTDVVEINSLTINEKEYTLTPSVEGLSVIYELLETEKPTLYVSRDDGVTWKEIKEDELTNLSDLPEGNLLRVKAVLQDGQELHGISYSWI